MKNNDLCVLVNACDKYIELLPITINSFRLCLNIENLKIYVSNESKSVSINSDNVLFLSEVRGHKAFPISAWGEQFRSSLRFIQENYVLLVQDDYYFYREIDTDLILRVVEIMKSNLYIGCVHLSDQVLRDFKSSYNIDGINLWSIMEGKYYLNTQVAIWRRDYLEKCLKSAKDPWMWELFGHNSIDKSGSLHLVVSPEQSVKYFAILKKGKYLPESVNYMTDAHFHSLSTKFAAYRFGRFEKFKLFLSLVKARIL